MSYSPDADDIFMYYAIKFGWVTPKDAKFENIAADIETLNQREKDNLNWALLWWNISNTFCS